MVMTKWWWRNGNGVRQRCEWWCNESSLTTKVGGKGKKEEEKEEVKEYKVDKTTMSTTVEKEKGIRGGRRKSITIFIGS